MGSGSARTEQSCLHPGSPRSSPCFTFEEVFRAHSLTFIPAAPPQVLQVLWRQVAETGCPPTPLSPDHLGIFLFVTIATILKLLLDPGAVVSTWPREIQ